MPNEIPPEHPEGQKLLQAIKINLPVLEPESLMADRRVDGYYRFFHQSFKVYRLQETTAKIVSLLTTVGEDSGVEECRHLNPWFMKIIGDGTGKKFHLDSNLRWVEETRPIVEAWFHSREMLRHVVACGKGLDRAPTFLPSDWAAVLYLYNIR